jgi:hypothetical protein
MHAHVGPELSLMTRTFAVLAAVSLVGAVGLAALLPGGMSLGQTIHAVDAEILFSAQTWVGHGIWNALAAPLLVRPVWMIPACLGIISVGGAVSGLNQLSGRATRKRS